MGFTQRKGGCLQGRATNHSPSAPLSWPGWVDEFLLLASAVSFKSLLFKMKMYLEEIFQ